MSNKEKLLGSAQKYIEKGQIAKAIKDYQQVVDLDPKDIRNRQKLAELYSRAKMNADAFGEYGAVAKHYTENGFYLKAIAVYKQMQRLDPEQVDVFHRLAELNVKQGLIGNALAEYRNLAQHFEKQKLYGEVIAVLRKMAELEPENLNIPIKIAELYALTGLREKAREEFIPVLSRLREADEYPRLIKLFELFGPLFPEDIEIKIGHAEVIIQKGEIEKGLQQLKSLLHENPDNQPILRALARGYRRKEDFENERLTCQHLLKLVPADAELLASYIRACMNAGDHKRAIDELANGKALFFSAGCGALFNGLLESLRQVLPHDVQETVAFSALQGNAEAAAGDTVAFASAEQVPVEAIERPVEATDNPEPPPSDMSEPEDSPGGFPGAVEPGVVEVDFDGAEEIPLEFLEDAAETTDSYPVPPADDEQEGSEPVSLDSVPLSDGLELELELELEMDEAMPILPCSDALLPCGNKLEVQGGGIDDPENSVVDAVAESPAADVMEGLVPEEALEEVEPEEALEEVEPEEALEEVEPEEALEEVERFSPPAFAGENLGAELRDLLSGLDTTPEPLHKVRAELEEAEFYLQQGLFKEAERVCNAVLDMVPGCAEAKEKLAGIETLRRKTGAMENRPGLLDKPGKSLDDEDWPGLKGLSEGQETERFNLRDLEADLAFEVENQFDAEDTESHFNLGIAYKEMGLLDDAVSEFEKAMNNPGRLVDSLTLKGSCLFEKGDHGSAEKVFKEGLGRPGLKAAERVSLFYEMGLMYESWGRPLEALDSFQSAADGDLFFRNVGEKIESLRKSLGLDSSAGKDDQESKGKKSRVSYI